MYILCVYAQAMYILQIYGTIGQNKYFRTTKRTGIFNEPAVSCLRSGEIENKRSHIAGIHMRNFYTRAAPHLSQLIQISPHVNTALRVCQRARVLAANDRRVFARLQFPFSNHRDYMNKSGILRHADITNALLLQNSYGQKGDSISNFVTLYGASKLHCELRDIYEHVHLQ